jgi:hypothetical protein
MMSVERQLQETHAEHEHIAEQVIPKTDDPGTGAMPGMANIEARVVTGIFASAAAAEAARRILIQGGFDDSVIVVSDQYDGAAPEYDASHTAAGSGLQTGGIIGVIVGALLGTVALLAPGIREMLPVGPALALIFALLIGAVFGALIGSITGLGSRSAQAERFNTAARSGGVTVAVRTQDAADAARAEELMRSAHPNEVIGFQEAL